MKLYKTELMVPRKANNHGTQSSQSKEKHEEKKELKTKRRLKREKRVYRQYYCLELQPSRVIFVHDPHILLRITETSLYNVDPLKPHFYTVKLGVTGEYIVCLILTEAVLTSTHNLCFEQNTKTNIGLLNLKIFMFGGKIFSIQMYLNRIVS